MEENTKKVITSDIILEKINSMRTTPAQRSERDKHGLIEVAGWEMCLNLLENWVKSEFKK